MIFRKVNGGDGRGGLSPGARRGPECHLAGCAQDSLVNFSVSKQLVGRIWGPEAVWTVAVKARVITKRDGHDLGSQLTRACGRSFQLNVCGETEAYVIIAPVHALLLEAPAESNSW